MKNITIKDVAKIANVSYSTVSRALSNSSVINAKTKEHVLKISKEQGYQVNAAARSLIIKKSKLLGLIVPDVNNPYYSEIALNLERHAQEAGYNLILCNSMRDVAKEEEQVRFLLQHQVDGIILTSTIKSNMHRWALRIPQNIPTVCIGDPLPNIEDNYVYTDNYIGGYLGIEYLYNLGHRSIMYMGHRLSSYAHRNRLTGVTKAFSDYNLISNFCDNHYDTNAFEDGYNLAIKYFEANFNHTAIFAASDALAVGVIKAADQCNISIPEDVSLIGYDNISYASLPRIELTTIEQPRKKIAKSTIELILNIANPLTSNNSINIVFKPTIVERNTCKKI